MLVVEDKFKVKRENKKNCVNYVVALGSKPKFYVP